jgi:hypothetical protein
MTQDTSTLTFTANSTGNDLRLTARLNGHVFFDQILSGQEIKVQHTFPTVDEEKYTVEIEMSGKLSEHTVIDGQGNIVEDRMIEISAFSLDEIALVDLFTDNCKYAHDFNGSQTAVVDKFFGDMGCNGIVKFEFSAPVYMWMLENM